MTVAGLFAALTSCVLLSGPLSGSDNQLAAGITAAVGMTGCTALLAGDSADQPFKSVPSVPPLLAKLDQEIEEWFADRIARGDAKVGTLVAPLDGDARRVERRIRIDPKPPRPPRDKREQPLEGRQDDRKRPLSELTCFKLQVFGVGHIEHVLTTGGEDAIAFAIDQVEIYFLVIDFQQLLNIIRLLMN